MLTDLLVKNASSDRLYVEDVFSTWLYTGTGASQTITNGINLSGKGGMVWLGGRGNIGSFFSSSIFDTSRGTTKMLRTNVNNAQATYSTSLTSFNSNGFSYGSDSDVFYNNVLNEREVSWTFREAPKFFDVVTYTGNGAATRDIAHSLGVSPGMIIVKNTGATSNWFVWHRSIDNNIIFLEMTDAAVSSTGFYFGNSSTQTASNFRILSAGGTNVNGNTYVAYLFAHDTTADGIVQCGSFTTDGSNNASVSLGWEPQWVLVKPSSGTGSWQLVDNMRGMSLTSNGRLFSNNTNAESVGTVVVSPNATGFTFGNVLANTTFIYVAIRRGPMRTPTDATKVFTPIARTATGATANVTTSFAPDAVISFQRTGVVGGVTPSWFDRLRGALRYLYNSSTAAEATTNSDTLTAFNNTTYTVGSDPGGLINNTTLTYVNYAFGRASGFFDVVCYTGNLTARTISHNLSVAPEMIIVKNRGAVSQWSCYHIALGNAGSIFLNATNAGTTSGSTFWNSTTPTSTVFSLGTNATVNANNNTYVAYLLATCPGVSKVGSYTGTGTTLQINCGFTNGARFVLIKRRDSTGDWYVWDTARGIIAGNDPYFLLNTADAEVTNTDYVDAYSAGFELSSTAPAALNANGGTYIFLAIA